MLFGEAVEQTLQLASESDQSVPGAIDAEVVASGVQQSSPCARTRASEQSTSTSPAKNCLYKTEICTYSSMSLQTAHANTEAVHIAAQHAPYRTPFGAAGKHRRSGSIAAVIGQRGVPRQRNGIRRGSDGPGMFPLRWWKCARAIPDYQPIVSCIAKRVASSSK